MESALALLLGVGALAVALSRGPMDGALFIAGVAAYTLARQEILRMRAERRRTRFGSIATVAIATLTLTMALTYAFTQ